jgi:hypothetical protein
MIGPHLRRGQDVDYSLYQSVQQFGYLLAPSVDVGPIGTVAVYERQPKNQGNNGAATISGQTANGTANFRMGRQSVKLDEICPFRAENPVFRRPLAVHVAKSLILRDIRLQ